MMDYLDKLRATKLAYQADLHTYEAQAAEMRVAIARVVAEIAIIEAKRRDEKHGA